MKTLFWKAVSRQLSALSFPLLPLHSVKDQLPAAIAASKLASPDPLLEPFSALSRSRDSFAIADAARDNAPSALRGGGGERNRTDDLLLAKQALSQLSYTPANSGSARVCRAVGDSGCVSNRESPHPRGRASINRNAAGAFACTVRLPR
jgi:hypothetical protein